MSLLANTPSWLIVTAFVSVSLNAVFLLAAFFEPYKSVMRWAWISFTHSTGKRLRAYMFTKNGTIKRIYKKIGSEGNITYNDEEYSINPKLQFNDLGIPTQIYKEGVTEPFNPYNDEGGRQMSTAELTRVMTSTKLPGIIEYLKKYWPVALVLVGTTILLAGGSLYMNWMIYDEAVQKGTELAGRAVQNATELSNQAG